MTDHALACKIARVWHSTCAAYPEATTPTITSMVARTCRVSTTKVLDTICDRDATEELARITATAYREPSPLAGATLGQNVEGWKGV